MSVNCKWKSEAGRCDLWGDRCFDETTMDCCPRYSESRGTWYCGNDVEDTIYSDPDMFGLAERE